MNSRAVLYLARAVAGLWAAFWIWFGLASGIAEGLPARGILIHTVTPGLGFVLLFAIAWKWELAGGILLIFVALLIAVAYPWLFSRLSPLTIALTDASLAGPPLVAGVLFVGHWWSASAPREP